MAQFSGQAEIEARLSLVREHIRCENEHDLPGIMQTFGNAAQYDDLPSLEHHAGRDAVATYYTQLLASMPDLEIDVQRYHATGDTVVAEVVVRGTHLGAWRGLPATGHSLAFPLCGVFTFDEDGRIAGERIYYDRASVLRQLGVFHEPQTTVGKLLTVLTHPVTMAHTAVRALRRR